MVAWLAVLWLNFSPLYTTMGTLSVETWELALMAVALYQLEHTRAPAFAVVDRAVDAAGALSRPAAKGWMNALLRRYLRERATLMQDVARDPVARWSHPAWWIARARRPNAPGSSFSSASASHSSAATGHLHSPEM